MKKSNSILTLIFAILTLVSGILGPILDGGEISILSLIIGIVLGVSALGMFFFGGKIKAIIPVVAVMVLSNYLSTWMETIMQSISSQLGSQLPTTSASNFETLGLMLTIAFVVAMVFAFKNGSKWAVIVSIVYSVLMLVGQVELFLTYAIAMDSISSSMEASALIGALLFVLMFVFANATQVSMFASIEPAKKQDAEVAE